jgi:hypothetical protein
MLLLTAVKSFCGLKVWKSLGKPNSVGVAPLFALTRKPVPGVLNTTPRGEVTLKKSAGHGLGSASVSGTPSQLGFQPMQNAFHTLRIPDFKEL